MRRGRSREVHKALHEWCNKTKRNEFKSKIDVAVTGAKIMDRSLLYKIVPRQVRAHTKNDENSIK